jgi:hypothetical protein
MPEGFRIDSEGTVLKGTLDATRECGLQNHTIVIYDT